MTNQHTIQQLERNSKPGIHEHAGDDFCIDCVTTDLLRDDFRYEVALVAAIDLKRLASVRASADNVASWRDRWRDVLDPDRLQADLNGEDVALRLAAEQARKSVGDFLIYRRAAYYRVTIPHAMRLMEIEKQTAERIAEIEREGTEPELLGHGRVN